MEKVADIIGQDAQKWMSDNSTWLAPILTGALGAGAGYFGTGDQEEGESDSEYRHRKLRNALILGGLTGGGTAAFTYGHKALESARPEEYVAPETKVVGAIGDYGPEAVAGAGGLYAGAKVTNGLIRDYQRDKADTNRKAIDAAEAKYKQDVADTAEFNKRVTSVAGAGDRASAILGSLKKNSTNVEDVVALLRSGKVDINNGTSAAEKALRALKAEGRLGELGEALGKAGYVFDNIHSLGLPEPFVGSTRTGTGFLGGADELTKYHTLRDMPTKVLPKEYKPSRALRRLGGFGGGLGGAAIGIGLTELARHLMGE